MTLLNEPSERDDAATALKPLKLSHLLTLWNNRALLRKLISQPPAARDDVAAALKPPAAGAPRPAAVRAARGPAVRSASRTAAAPSRCPAVPAQNTS